MIEIPYKDIVWAGPRPSNEHVLVRTGRYAFYKKWRVSFGNLEQVEGLFKVFEEKWVFARSVPVGVKKYTTVRARPNQYHVGIN